MMNEVTSVPKRRGRSDIWGAELTRFLESGCKIVEYENNRCVKLDSAYHMLKRAMYRIKGVDVIRRDNKIYLIRR